MAVGATEIVQARAGSRIAIVTPTWAAAGDELERLALLAGDDAVITRANGRQKIRYGTGGELRIISAGAKTAERGRIFDEVIVFPDVASSDIIARYKPTLAITGGDIRIDL